MSYQKRLDRAFTNAPVLPISRSSKYVFFSDLHRGIGNANDNFLKNNSTYLAALQYYYQYDFTYIEVGDGDELWENRSYTPILETYSDIFEQLHRFHQQRHLYMLYGNHDLAKKEIPCILDCIPFYESIILKSTEPPVNLYVTHGHQADFLNSVLWKLARFLVRYLWAPLEAFGIQDPTSASKNNKKKEKLEHKLINYARQNNCLLLAGHTHRPYLGDTESPYYNCGSCVRPKYITCIELCGYSIRLVKWYSTAERSQHFGNIYTRYPPAFPVYIKRELLAEESLI